MAILAGPTRSAAPQRVEHAVRPTPGVIADWEEAGAGLKRLQTLDLGGTGVTDPGLKELAGLKQLRWLDLAGTGVTDAGLHELTGLKRLELLCLPGQVTDAGIATLQTALPLATITASRPPYTCRRDVKARAAETAAAAIGQDPIA